MGIKKGLIFGLAACLVATLVPAQAFASGDSSSATATPAAPKSVMATIDFRASATRALTTTDVTRTATLAPKPAARRDASPAPPTPPRQGGAGKMGMIMGLVGTVAGLGMTYVIYKQMKKNTNNNTSGGQ